MEKKYHFLFFIIIFGLTNLSEVKGNVRVKRVIGGTPANADEYGFLAALIGTQGYSWDKLRLWGEHRRVYCSGTLINRQWILTAAHCFYNIQVERQKTDKNDDDDDDESIEDQDDWDDDYPEEAEERLGTEGDQLYLYNTTLSTNQIVRKIKQKYQNNPINISEPENMIHRLINFSNPVYWKVRLSVKKLEPSFTERFFNIWNRITRGSKRKTYYKVTKIIPHPKYTPWLLEYDIGLMKLDSKIDPEVSQVMPIFNESDMDVWPPKGQLCKVIGWGCNEVNGPMMNEPYSVKVPIISPGYCRDVFRSDINLTEEHEFCAGYYNGDIGICPGDSGGPLICTNYKGMSSLAGVVSAAHINNPKNYPGIYSRVSYFKQWILDTIKND